MCGSPNFLEKVAYVLASEHRKNIILFLSNELYTPKQIGDGIGVRTNHISNLLAQLREQDLVYCATPAVKRGRLYTLTDNGKKVLEYIQKQQK